VTIQARQRSTIMQLWNNRPWPSSRAIHLNFCNWAWTYSLASWAPRLARAPREIGFTDELMILRSLFVLGVFHCEGGAMAWLSI
jgi:hypothetical protein